MNRRLKRILKVVLPLAFGLLILWLLYRHMDMQALLSTLKSDARFGVIFLGCLFGTLGNTIRGLRWQLLNRTLDPEVSCINSILTTHGNYGATCGGSLESGYHVALLRDRLWPTLRDPLCGSHL